MWRNHKAIHGVLWNTLSPERINERNSANSCDVGGLYVGGLCWNKQSANNLAIICQFGGVKAFSYKQKNTESVLFTTKSPYNCKKLTVKKYILDNLPKLLAF